MHAEVVLLVMFVFIIVRFRYHGRAVWRALREGIVLIPVVILAVLWVRSLSAEGDIGIARFLGRYYLTQSLGFFDRIKSLLLYDNHFVLRGRPGRIVAAAFALCAVLPGVYFLLRSGKSARPGLNDRKLSPVIILVVISVVLYLVLPYNLPGMHPVYVRMSVFCLLSMVLLCAVSAPALPRRYALPLICVPVLVHLALWTGYFRDFNRENAVFTEKIFPSDVGGKRLVGLIYDNDYRGQFIYMHFPNYHIVWRRGIAATSLVGYRYGPIRCKVGDDVLPAPNEWIWRNDEFDERYARLEYILVRGEIPEHHAGNLTAHSLIKSEPPWSVYGKSGE
jgi:hypothetical protein